MNAFFKGIKDLKTDKPEIIILTKLTKRYKNKLNSKYTKLKKYNRYTFENTNT